VCPPSILGPQYDYGCWFIEGGQLKFGGKIALIPSYSKKQIEIGSYGRKACLHGLASWEGFSHS